MLAIPDNCLLWPVEPGLVQLSGPEVCLSRWVPAKAKSRRLGTLSPVLAESRNVERRRCVKVDLVSYCPARKG